MFTQLSSLKHKQQFVINAQKKQSRRKQHSCLEQGELYDQRQGLPQLGGYPALVVLNNNYSSTPSLPLLQPADRKSQSPLQGQAMVNQASERYQNPNLQYKQFLGDGQSRAESTYFNISQPSKAPLHSERVPEDPMPVSRQKPPSRFTNNVNILGKHKKSLNLSNRSSIKQMKQQLQRKAEQEKKKVMDNHFRKNIVVHSVRGQPIQVYKKSLYKQLPRNLGSRDQKFRDINMEAHQNMEALKLRVLQERGLSILYRVDKLNNIQMSKEKAIEIFRKRLNSLESNRKVIQDYEAYLSNRGEKHKKGDVDVYQARSITQLQHKIASKGSNDIFTDTFTVDKLKGEQSHETTQTKLDVPQQLEAQSPSFKYDFEVESKKVVMSSSKKKRKPAELPEVAAEEYRAEKVQLNLLNV